MSSLRRLVTTPLPGSVRLRSEPAFLGDPRRPRQILKSKATSMEMRPSVNCCVAGFQPGACLGGMDDAHHLARRFEALGQMCA